MADDIADLGPELARANRLVKLALIVLLVAVLVLAIDYRLKNFIIREGQVALGLLNKAQGLAEAVRESGQTRPDSGGAADSGPVGAADGVGDDAGAGADVAVPANGRGPAPAGRPPRAARGPGGHGGRTGGAA